MHTFSYDNSDWRQASKRIRERDANCLLHILGDCRGPLHAHHLDPISKNEGDPFDEDRCVTLCERHHPIFEAVQRKSGQKREWKRCRHKHPYPWGREICEQRLNAA